MKIFILALLFVASVAADSEETDDAGSVEDVNVDEAQFPMSPMGMGMNPMMMGGMGPMGMGGMGMNPMMMNPMMMNPMMGGPQNNFQSNQGYAVDYNLPCSNSCGCARMCIPMMPCHCTCPPPCPPQETTVEPPSNQYPKCENGAPDFAYPDCCYNGGRGAFCCLNGANNLHCCLNGANNPWCSLPTQPPPVGTPPGGSPPGNDCNQCHCQPCIPWIPCPPCPCRNACGK